MEQGADYVFGLKGNQTNLSDDIRSFVAEKGETRNFITSLTDAAAFTRAVRSYWGIENSLHYCLDVTFNEDTNRTRKDSLPENFAVIRHIALNILEKFKTQKPMSVVRKRRKCQYDSNFMTDVLLLACLRDFSCVSRVCREMPYCHYASYAV